LCPFSERERRRRKWGQRERTVKWGKTNFGFAPVLKVARLCLFVLLEELMLRTGKA
jgi:hypothetical protein